MNRNIQLEKTSRDELSQYKNFGLSGGDTESPVEEKPIYSQ